MDPILQQQAEENEKLFAHLDAYPWDTDAEFQVGLSAILGNATSPTQIQALTLRARCFYYSRKNNNIPIDFEAYRTHVLSSNPDFLVTPPPSAPATPANRTNHSSPPSSDTPTATNNEQAQSGGDPQYPQSFAHLVSLIQSGAPIPGIKDIPPTVLPEQATAPTASRRRKPWEKDDVSEGDLDGSKAKEGTFGDRRDEVIVQEYPED